MTRPLITRAAACLGVAVLVATGLPFGSAAHAAPRTAARDDSPMAVTLDSMSPSALPRRGMITLTGDVTNRSDETWTDLQVYLFHSAAPITDRAALAEAAATDPAANVGSRITTEGRFDEIGDLAPGETTSYSVSVRRGDLTITGDPGVYWIGTHVLGAVDGVRDGLAAGRARSFVPLMQRSAPTTELALVLPLRARVRRGPDGSLLGLHRWQRAIGDDGRLGRLASFAADGDGGVSWLVDPAVLDAIGSVANDDPPFSLAADGSGPEGEGGEGEASESPSPSPTDEQSADADDGEEPAEPTPEALRAGSWLRSFTEQAADAPVLALPYGDLDVPAVIGNGFDPLLRTARRLSADSMSAYELDTDPVIAPPRGLLPNKALTAVDPDTTVLLSDVAYPDIESSVVGRSDGTRLVLADTAAASGGPGPGRRKSALAIRQRLLADAALQALSPQRDEPLVVSLPPRFDPGADWASADFFEGLDVPWLGRVGLDSVLGEGASATTSAPPLYPAAQRAAHVPTSNLLATQELGDLGEVFADLLTLNDNIADQLARAGMLASSYSVRDHEGAALVRARETTLRVRRTLQNVVVDGPPFVMMSSETGPIAVTVENQLEAPVTVRLEVQARTPDLTITPPDPITLGPGQRAPVRMRADATRIGVHAVNLVATTASGAPLGSTAQFTVRSSNVGIVIWVVLGAAGAVLALAIVVRLVRRVRAARSGAAGTPAGDAA